MNRDAPPQPDQPELFFRLFATNESRLFSYIITLLPHWADAEEVYQETCVVLWREFHRFDPDATDSDFVRWATAIARNRVLAFRSRQNRRRRLLSDRAMDLVAKEAAERSDELAERTVALRECMAELSPRHRELLEVRYGHGTDPTVEAYAHRTARPASQLYATLKRLRQKLLDCINRRKGPKGTV